MTLLAETGGKFLLVQNMRHAAIADVIGNVLLFAARFQNPPK